MVEREVLRPLQSRAACVERLRHALTPLEGEERCVRP
jgi:hypothetical protein